MQTYKVLKECLGFMPGDEVATDQLLTEATPDDIAALIVDGTIDPIFAEGSLEDHTVTEQDLIDNPTMAKTGIKEGDVIQRPKASDATSPVAPIAPVAPVDGVSPTLPDPQAEAVVPEEPCKRFNGQIVISDGYREVNGNKFRHIRIADGSTYDLSEAEYRTQVKVAYQPSK